MNTFKRKALASAVLGTLGVAGSAQAIYQDPNNTGQVLVYPYYTVNNDGAGNQFNTFISVINTTSAVKLVKVRFREGQASAEVLDFNLYLSPNDMWTSAVIPLSTDVASPGALVSTDTSCVDPAKITLTPQPFVNFAYTGAAADVLANGSLVRTREGYAEMFEMGVLTAGSAPAVAATHVSGTPPCTAAQLIGPAGEAAVTAVLLPPTGGLMGSGTIINVTSGRDTMYNATAFGAWSSIATPASLATDQPNFSNTFPAASAVFGLNSSAGTPPTQIPNAYFSTWLPTASFVGGSGVGGAPALAASATMMHSDVINEFILDSATASATDWVLTFPTKRLFVAPNGSTAVAPFTTPLAVGAGACEVIDLTFFNREEGTAVAGTGAFSPNPPGAPSNTLCWESSIVSFRNGSATAPSTPAAPSLVLGSANVTTIGVTAGFQNGWASIHFSGAGASTTGMTSAAGGAPGLSTTTNMGTAAQTVLPQTFLGLPVIGFMVRTFTNGTLHCGTASCLGNYMGSDSHAYRNNITP